MQAARQIPNTASNAAGGRASARGRRNEPDDGARRSERRPGSNFGGQRAKTMPRSSQKHVQSHLRAPESRNRRMAVPVMVLVSALIEWLKEKVTARYRIGRTRPGLGARSLGGQPEHLPYRLDARDGLRERTQPQPHHLVVAVQATGYVHQQQAV